MNRKILFLIIFIILIFPVVTHAAELNISNWNVESTLYDNGDLNILEDISFRFSDSYNGVFRYLNKDRVGHIDSIKVYELKDGEEIEYLLDNDAIKGDSRAFSLEEGSSGINVKIFSPSRDETKTFRLKYILTDIAQMQNGVGELYYKFIGNENETPIDKFTATITLPQFDKEKIKIFGHGPLNGNIYFTDENTIRLVVEDVPKNTFIEARVLYPLEYTPFSNNKKNKTLEDILREENYYIANIENKEQRRKANARIFNSISMVIWVFALGIIAYIVKTFRRDPSIYSNMDAIYPEDISPAEINLFMNSALNYRGLMSTLFDLARRELITIDQIDIQTKRKKSKNQDYIFFRTFNIDSKLLNHESYLMDWLFNEMGDGEKVTTDDMNKYLTKKTTAYSKRYSAWSSLVKKALDARGYDDLNSNKPGFILLAISFVFLSVGIISVVAGAIYGVGTIILGGFFLIYGFALLARKSDKGYIQYQLWKDFKKEVQSLGKVNIAIPNDKNIINAIALGLNMESLDNYREQIEHNYIPIYWGAWFFSQNGKGGSKFEDNFNRSFFGSVGSSTSTSSSFGGGGGFSGGGGGGAGGGGAGGF